MYLKGQEIQVRVLAGVDRYLREHLGKIFPAIVPRNHPTSINIPFKFLTIEPGREYVIDNNWFEIVEDVTDPSCI